MNPEVLRGNSKEVKKMVARTGSCTCVPDDQGWDRQLRSAEEGVATMPSSLQDQSGKFRE